MQDQSDVIFREITLGTPAGIFRRQKNGFDPIFAAFEATHRGYVTLFIRLKIIKLPLDI